jgi:Fe-S-cluster containining protein
VPTPKFQCLKCGSCCRNIKAKESGEEKPTPFFLEKSNVIVLTKPSLLIQDWEKTIFKEIDIFPSTILFDIKNNRSLVLTYTISSSSCPLITKDNTCQAYNNRPLACRGFPCPYVDTSMQIGSSINSSICPAETEISKMSNQDPQSYRKYLKERYQDSFIARLIQDFSLDYISKLITELAKENKLKLANASYPIDFLKKRIKNSPLIDVSQLIQEHTGSNFKDMIQSQDFKNMIEKDSSF